MHICCIYLFFYFWRKGEKFKARYEGIKGWIPCWSFFSSHFLPVVHPGENRAVLLSRSALRKRKKHARKLGLGLHLSQQTVSKLKKQPLPRVPLRRNVLLRRIKLKKRIIESHQSWGTSNFDMCHFVISWWVSKMVSAKLVLITSFRFSLEIVVKVEKVELTNFIYCLI